MAAMDSKEEECPSYASLSHSFSLTPLFHLSLMILLPPLAISQNKNGSNKPFNVIPSKYYV